MTTPDPAAVDAEVRKLYGDVAAYLDHPELGPILRKAAQEGWDSSRLFGALQQTKYWKSNSEPQRKWGILYTLDPAEAERQRQQQTIAVAEMARGLGFTYTAEQQRYFAGLALANGWSGDQLREHLVARERTEFGKGNEGNFTNLVSQQYGYLAAFLDEPEVGDLLLRAARENWNEQRLSVELQKTQWWQTTTDSQRRWDALSEQNPGDAEAQITGRSGEVEAMARQLGISLSPERLRVLTENSLRYGWQGEQLRQAVGREYEYGGGLEKQNQGERRQSGNLSGMVQTEERNEFGLAATTEQQVRQIAGEYLIPMSPATMERWVEQIVRGEVDIAGFTSYVTEQAKSLFPGMAAALDRGVTVAQYADPYRQIIARELELNPDSIDLSNPKYRPVLDQVDAKGNRVSMTLTEAAEFVRKQPEWQTTRGANERAASLTENILQTFGAVR